MKHFPHKLAIVDLETTGLSPAQDRIIDIGVIIIQNGEVVEEFETLVDPQRHVSTFIEKYTGISRSELNYAPTFRQLADELWIKLSNTYIVAHNARFDYGFLQNSFSRQKLDFNNPKICTVKLARRLYPEMKKYNLDKIMTYFGIGCVDRHRALGDAKVVWEFLNGRVKSESLLESVEY